MSIESIGNKCCACRACLQTCKRGAITFVTDEYGFEYPKIDVTLCTNCGLCEHVCPIATDTCKTEAIHCGMAYALDPQTKHQGSSGGLFGVFAESVIAQGGVVFGAAFDANLKLKTTKAETLEELIPLYKSKYLLCDTDYQFDEIERELKTGRMVLYCSSPCQIAALKLYLKKDYENLLTIDFVCHGVGSQSVFDKSIAYTQERESIEIRNVTLRSKTGDASLYYYTYDYLKDGKKRKKSDLYFSFPYFYAYCMKLVCRDSCYDCKYATRERVGDITIGDFHSVLKYFPEIDRFAGVSMFLVNTEKGQRWFDLVKDKLHWEDMDREIIYQNNRFSDEVVIPKDTQAFRDSIATEPFAKTVKRFLGPTRDLKKRIYYKTPRFIRKMVLKTIMK